MSDHSSRCDLRKSYKFLLHIRKELKSISESQPYHVYSALSYRDMTISTQKQIKLSLVILAVIEWPQYLLLLPSEESISLLPEPGVALWK